MILILRNLPLKIIYDTANDEIVYSLFFPLFQESYEYSRGVGYFSYTWLTVNASGLANFLYKEGKIRLMISQYLTKEEAQAMELGERARKDELLKEKLMITLDELEDRLEHDTLAVLSWLLAEEKLELQIIVPKNGWGDYHDKLAIFTDEYGDSIVLHGSINDSLHALFNGEGITVFKSWIAGQKEYVKAHIDRFNKLYAGNHPFYDNYSLPKAVYNRILDYKKSIPKPAPAYLRKKPEQLNISIPEWVHLRNYQKTAISNWFVNGKIGMYYMATATGKTPTSLSASAYVYKQNLKICLIVSVPFIHLLNQWELDLKSFNYSPILCCGNKREWMPIAESEINDFNLGLTDNICLIVTHKTNADDDFSKIIGRVKEKQHILFIADEVHYLGAKILQKTLLNFIPMRIGLSATPDRWRDPRGTQILKDYFGKETIHLEVDEAIKKKYLCPYDYYPHIVELTSEEWISYVKLSQKIAIRKDAPEEELNTLLRQRVNILHRAEWKDKAFLEIFKRDIEKYGKDNFSHILVYTAEGNIYPILRSIQELGISTEPFTYQEDSARRKQLLLDFKTGKVKVLVAMRCLDEGVNIPATRHAYILASSTNPKQANQRRGRILRPDDGKQFAIIHDFIVVPPTVEQQPTKGVRKLVMREMMRFMEFNQACRTPSVAEDIVYDLLKRTDLLYLYSIKKEDFYKYLGGYDEYDTSID